MKRNCQLGAGPVICGRSGLKGYELIAMHQKAASTKSCDQISTKACLPEAEAKAANKRDEIRSVIFAGCSKIRVRKRKANKQAVRELSCEISFKICGGIQTGAWVDVVVVHVVACHNFFLVLWLADKEHLGRPLRATTVIGEC